MVTRRPAPRTRTRPAARPTGVAHREDVATCPEATQDLKSLLASLRPLGESGAVIAHAAACPTCFGKLREVFLTTAPDEHDPVHRLFDGLNHALYRVAKSLLHASGAENFRFDHAPAPLEGSVREAEDRLAALEEYSEGGTSRSATTQSLKSLLQDAARGAREGVAEGLLKRSVSFGGRYGLDAANLLGYLKYAAGDFDGAELLFRTVIERQPADTYESETRAHAMNNLTGVHAGRGDVRTAILWCERSLMLKERLGLDAKVNHFNLVFFWLETGTSYGSDRARHYLRTLMHAEGGKAYLERTLAGQDYAAAVKLLRTSGLDREFPELKLPIATGRKLAAAGRRGE